MNILWITPDIPFNKQYGGDFDVSARIEFAHKAGVKNYLLSFTKEPINEQIQQKLQNYCERVHIVQRPQNKLYIFNKRPYSAVTRNSNKLCEVVGKFCEYTKIDIACLESLHVGEIVPLLKRVEIPFILRAPNIESQYFKELGRAHQNLLSKFIYTWEAKKLAKYEKLIYDQSQKILCLSVYESEQLKHLYPNAYISWLPPAVKLEVPSNQKCDSGPVIAFSGSMYIPNNVRAVEWFSHEVFPEILRSIPNAEFWIIGRKPTMVVKKLGKLRNVRITGEVSSTHELLLEARVVVAPLFHGAGVKIKILEAIGLGKPVVATSEAIIGTTLKPGYNVLVADDSETFATLCVRVLREPKVFEDLRLRAREYFNSHHEVEAVGRKFLAELSFFDIQSP